MPRLNLGDFAAHGASDNAPALRAALGRLAAVGGGILEVPKATYTLQSLITPAGLSDAYRCFAEIPPNCRIEGQAGSTFRATPGLSDAGAWSFLLGRYTKDFRHVGLRGLTFDYNGANNLLPGPLGVYRPCVGVWVIVEKGAAAELVSVTDCEFLDNPGANSISVVDNAPSGTANPHLTSVVIERNRFVNFGYAVGNNSNVNNNDHSCVYVQAKQALIRHNLFRSDYLLPDPFTGGHTCIDLHSEEAEITENTIDGAITFVVDQCNGFIASYRHISNNTGHNTERFYAPFDGTQHYRNVHLTRNSLAIRSTGRELPVFDFWNAISTTDYFDVFIEKNRAAWTDAPWGRTANFVRAKRGIRFNVIGNDVHNCPGTPIHIDANADVLDWAAHANRFVGYGGGAGAETAIDLDMTATGSEHTVSITDHNLFSAGTGTNWLSNGVRVAGSFRKLLVHGNDYDRVRIPVATRLLHVSGECSIENVPDLNGCSPHRP